METSNNRKLGINGFGRIGKLTVWHHVARKYFKELVVNIGRRVGTSIGDIAHYLERDSTYGTLQRFLYGHKEEQVISDINEKEESIIVDGIRVTFLRTHRNPKDIDWRTHKTKLVVDTTGKFPDPTVGPEAPKGSLRGHLEAGAEKVIVSAPFRIKDHLEPMPSDSVTTVMGVNADDYDGRVHKIVSHASCTTTGLAHMMKPLMNHFGPGKILSASVATVHASTGSQPVLDRLPGDGNKDLRKNRSVMNNIILTPTGAADALRLVIPEMKHIGFIAESVRIPVTTGSLIILVVNFQEDISGSRVERELLNDIYRKAALSDPYGYLRYSDKQNVSSDIIGLPRAAVIIEGHETHRRTAEIRIDLEKVLGSENEVISSLRNKLIRVPVTHAVVYGWYDNEMGSYVNMLADRTVSIAEDMRTHAC